MARQANDIMAVQELQKDLRYVNSLRIIGL